MKRGPAIYQRLLDYLNGTTLTPIDKLWKRRRPTVFVNFDDRHPDWHAPPDDADIPQSKRVIYHDIRRITDLGCTEARRFAACIAFMFMPDSSELPGDDRSRYYQTRNAGQMGRLQKMTRPTSIAGLIDDLLVTATDRGGTDQNEWRERIDQLRDKWWRRVRCRMAIRSIRTDDIEWYPAPRQLPKQTDVVDVAMP